MKDVACFTDGCSNVRLTNKNKTCIKLKLMVLSINTENYKNSKHNSKS